MQVVEEEIEAADLREATGCGALPMDGGVWQQLERGLDCLFVCLITRGQESGFFPFRSLAACGARLGGVVAGLFGQRRQCRLRGKVSIGQVIIPCIGITHFLY